VLHPRVKHTVPGKVLGGNFRMSPCPLCGAGIEGVCVARVLTSPSVGIHRKLPVGKSILSTSCTELNTSVTLHA
jgi:hypothetical protein